MKLFTFVNIGCSTICDFITKQKYYGIDYVKGWIVHKGGQHYCCEFYIKTENCLFMFETINSSWKTMAKIRNTIKNLSIKEKITYIN